MKRLLCAVIAAIAVAGCSTPYYKQVLNEKPVANCWRFPYDADTLYQAVAQAMLERNFSLENENIANRFLLGKRVIQDGRRTASILLQAKVVASGENASTVYLNGVQTTEVSYVADKTRFLLFVIPLPGGGGKEASSIKEGEKTITDPQFYQMFFKTIEAAAPTVIPAAQTADPAPALSIVPAAARVPVATAVEETKPTAESGNETDN